MIVASSDGCVLLSRAIRSYPQEIRRWDLGVESSDSYHPFVLFRSFYKYKWRYNTVYRSLSDSDGEPLKTTINCLDGSFTTEKDPSS